MGSGNRSSPRSVALSRRSKSPTDSGSNYLCVYAKVNLKRPAEQYPVQNESVHVISDSPVEHSLCADGTFLIKQS